MAGKPKDPIPALIGSARPAEGQRPHKQIKFLDSRIARSSSAGNFHSHALTVPDVNLSVHPAPIDRPQGARPVASEKTAKAVGF